MRPSPSFDRRLTARLFAILCFVAVGYGVAPSFRPAAIAPASTAAQTIPPQPSPRARPALVRRAGLPGPYPVEVLSVIDGDTFEARVRVWFGQEITTLVRTRGFDAPELHARCAEEKRGALEARDELARLLALGPVSIADLGVDKYGGRVDASVYVEELAGAPPSPIADIMLAAGLARPYEGGKRGTWCAANVAGR